MSNKINDTLLTALQRAESALDACGPGASKAQILSQAIYARAEIKDALRKLEEEMPGYAEAQYQGHIDL